MPSRDRGGSKVPAPSQPRNARSTGAEVRSSSKTGQKECPTQPLQSDQRARPKPIPKGKAKEMREGTDKVKQPARDPHTAETPPVTWDLDSVVPPGKFGFHRVPSQVNKYCSVTPRSSHRISALIDLAASSPFSEIGSLACTPPRALILERAGNSSVAHSPGYHFFSFDDGDCIPADSDQKDDDGGQILITFTPQEAPARGRRELKPSTPIIRTTRTRTITPTRPPLPKTIMGVDAPPRRSRKGSAPPAPEEDLDDCEKGHHSDPEPYATPTKKKKAPAKKKATRARSTGPKGGRGGGKKRVEFQVPDDGEDFTAEVNAVRDGSGEELSIGPRPLPPESDQVGSRLFKDDRPHIFKIYAEDIVPFFTMNEDGIHADCILCKEYPCPGRSKDGAYTEGSSTGTIRTHLFTCHPKEWITACDTNDPPIVIQGSTYPPLAAAFRAANEMQVVPMAGRPKFSHQFLGETLAKLVVVEDLPIRLVDSITFRHLMLGLRETLSDKSIPHRTQLSALIMQMFVREMHGLIKIFKSAMGRISTTTDCWTDPNLFPYMAVIGHWIQAVPITDANLRVKLGVENQLVYRSDIIGFYGLPISHTGEHLSETFIHVMDRLEILHALGYITLDNASNNQTMVSAIERKLIQMSAKFPKPVKFSADQNKLSCFAHTLALGCGRIIEEIDNDPELALLYATSDAERAQIPQKGIFTRVKEMCRQTRSSGQRRADWDAVAELQLLRATDTRWSSSYIMMKRMKKMHPQLVKFVYEYGYTDITPLSEGERALITAVLQVLKWGHYFQQSLSTAATPMLCDFLPSLLSVITKWKSEKKNHPRLAHAIQAGIDKLMDYWDKFEDTEIYRLAQVVHPSYRLRWFQKHTPEDVSYVREIFYKALEEIELPENLNQAAATKSSSTNYRRMLDDSDDEGASTGVPGQISARAEGKAYLEYSDTTQYDSALSAWEKVEYQRTFPRVFRLAMDILPVQGTSVPCERAFSSAKLTITDNRNRLGPDFMEALQVLKHLWGKNTPLNYTEHLKKQNLVQELEDSNARDDQAPEALDSYIKSLRGFEAYLPPPPKFVS